MQSQHVPVRSQSQSLARDVDPFLRGRGGFEHPSDLPNPLSAPTSFYSQITPVATSSNTSSNHILDPPRHVSP